MNNTDKMIEVVQAHQQGKPVESATSPSDVHNDWKEISAAHTFDFSTNEYRVKTVSAEPVQPSEILEIIQSFKEGKKIESRILPSQANLDPTWNLDLSPSFNFSLYEYRVKSEPLQFWVTIHGKDKNTATVYSSKQAAEQFNPGGHLRTILVQEVIDPSATP